MAKRLIGTATTNANGVASVTYTGAGRGLLNVFAESGSLQSEIFEVWDYVKFDNGTIASHNDIWTKQVQTSEIVRYDEYTSVSEGSGTYADVRTQITNQDCIIELDVKNDSMNGWIIGIFQSSTQLTGFGLLQDSFNQWTHLKIEIQGSTIKAYYNNETSARVIRNNMNRDTSQPLNIALQTPQSITTIDFKDFKVYPI